MERVYIQISQFDSVKSVVAYVKEATFFRKQIGKNYFILKLIC